MPAAANPRSSPKVHRGAPASQRCRSSNVFSPVRTASTSRLLRSAYGISTGVSSLSHVLQVGPEPNGLMPRAARLVAGEWIPGLASMSNAERRREAMQRSEALDDLTLWDRLDVA